MAMGQEWHAIQQARHQAETLFHDLTLLRRPWHSRAKVESATHVSGGMKCHPSLRKGPRICQLQSPEDLLANVH